MAANNGHIMVVLLSLRCCPRDCAQAGGGLASPMAAGGVQRGWCCCRLLALQPLTTSA